eukprot:1159792-Pelagomonas_calceolata.AAC.3
MLRRTNAVTSFCDDGAIGEGLDTWTSWQGQIGTLPLLQEGHKNLWSALFCRIDKTKFFVHGLGLFSVSAWPSWSLQGFKE